MDDLGEMVFYEYAEVGGTSESDSDSEARWPFCSVGSGSEG